MCPVAVAARSGGRLKPENLDLNFCIPTLSFFGLFPARNDTGLTDD